MSVQKLEKTIKELGRTMLEDLSTPTKNLNQLKKEDNKKLKNKNIFNEYFLKL